MILLNNYKKLINSGEIFPEPQQLAVIQELEILSQTLLSEKKSLLRFKKTPPKGLYLWGGVGIGKTLLLDTFYHSLPFQNKWRTHFLPFMREVHTELHRLQGTTQPLQQLARQWAKKARVICFDEFLVDDIADAAILGGLLDALFQQGICVVFTSNFAPDELYKNGLQRDLFLPTIASIKQQTKVIHLAINDDYRTSQTRQVKYYWYPLTTLAQENLESIFVKLAKGSAVNTTPLRICERDIRIKKQAADVVWFDFLAICGIPRSYEDYLIIAEKFPNVIISNVTAIRPYENDLARSFIQLIDVLYEAKTRLVISAALPISQLYTQGQLLFEFTRTQSRLIQMQSADWEKNK